MDEVDALLADLARWSAESQADDAATSRRRERWLRQQAAESAHFIGVALDLCERGIPVTVRTTSGRSLHGRMAAVGRDFCLMQDSGGPPTFLTLPALAVLRPDAGARMAPAASERTAPVDTRLVDVLVGLAGERPRVRALLEGAGEALTGELRSVGIDVATLRLDGDPPSTVYVQLASLRELTLLS